MDVEEQDSGGSGGGISTINADPTVSQTISLGSTGTDANIVDNGSGDHKIHLPTASATNRGLLSSTDWSTFNNKQPAGSYQLTSAKAQPNGYASLDANTLIPIAQIPPAALERLVVVADQPARYALTTATVQNGDTVFQQDTSTMYFVKDDTNLANSNGYQVYSAGTSVGFSGSLSGDVTGGQSSTSISATTVTGKALTGYGAASGAVAATDSIITAIAKVEANANSRELIYRTINTENTALNITSSMNYIRSGTLTASRIYSLPAASTVIGKTFTINKTDSTAYTITIAPNGSDTINGVASSLILASQNESVTLLAALSGVWEIIG